MVIMMDTMMDIGGDIIIGNQMINMTIITIQIIHKIEEIEVLLEKI